MISNIKNELIKQARLELARRDFFEYCKLTAPDFYKEKRNYLKKLCKEMQEFDESDEEVCIINIPPRHGKSRTAGKFVEWKLGNDKTKKIMTGSYNETLSTTFSKSVRNAIKEEKADENIIIFKDIFPNVKIKDGDGAVNLWGLDGGYNNYLATSPTGTATGFGASYIIIDDLIKSSMEAFNENILEKQWQWFTDTMLSRLEEHGKIIIIMTRWATGDLAGRALEHFKKLGLKVRSIIMKAVQDDGTMLCDEILSRKSYEVKTKTMSKEIAEANYNQKPIDLEGRLYKSFKTYTDVPKDDKGKVLFTKIKNYTDTADEGDDYLCSITYGEYNKEAYVLDVYFTKDSMETTEKELARRLYNLGVNHAEIESNNGGKGFARSVERILKDNYDSNKCVIKWFHQSNNKTARILSNSSWVMEHIYFPINWRDKWPDYYADMNKYQKEGKNAHDDAEDATTGIAEKMQRVEVKVFAKNSLRG